METKLTTQDIEVLVNLIEEFTETLILNANEEDVFMKLRLMLNE